MVLMIQRKKPMALKLAYKATKQVFILHYFISTSWIIKTDKLKTVINRLNTTDEEEFLFDMKQLDWHDATFAGIECLRYSINDTMDSLPYAKKRYRKLKILHYITVTIISMVVFFFLFKIICS
ncbi:fatty acyl-CoA reductase wat-like [Ceratina calcarata]|nr:fatty acyl-CoA reductase wat-like [Ceratina calcarata]